MYQNLYCDTSELQNPQTIYTVTGNFTLANVNIITIPHSKKKSSITQFLYENKI